MKQAGSLYDKSRWRKRAARQMQEHPLCAFCLQKGIVTAASVADHITPHHGDHYLFWFGKLQSLCLSCHNKTKHQIELHGYADDIGIDGFPIDRAHPFYRAT